MTAPEREAPISDRLLGATLLAGGLIGALAAFLLIVEKITVLENPAHVPACSINPVLSCGAVMNTDQAAVFGFANPLLGVAAFPVVAATGAALLGRVRLPRWWWWALQTGAVFGIGFVHWLIFQSLYRIGALCPYCMVVWVCMIVIFVYLSLHTVGRGLVPAPSALRRAARAAAQVHAALVLCWLLVIAVLAGVEFWSFWRRVL